MPRVAVNKYKYIEKDAANFINGKTRECKKEDKDVAAVIGISSPAYSLRRKDGRFYMNYIDLVKIIELLQLSDEEIVSLMRGRFGGRKEPA